LLHSEGSASDERLDRIPRLPAVCDHPTENTPAGNLFSRCSRRRGAQHYISFDLKKTDWGKVVEANRFEDQLQHHTRRALRHLAEDDRAILATLTHSSRPRRSTMCFRA
jgi:hypothetical protein